MTRGRLRRRRVSIYIYTAALDLADLGQQVALSEQEELLLLNHDRVATVLWDHDVVAGLDLRHDQLALGGSEPRTHGNDLRNRLLGLVLFRDVDPGRGLLRQLGSLDQHTVHGRQHLLGRLENGGHGSDSVSMTREHRSENFICPPIFSLYSALSFPEDSL